MRASSRDVTARFWFSKDGLQYIDYNSANGSYIDGIRAEANTPIDIRDSSVITIAPFQIVAQVNLVDARRLSNDPNALTPTVALRPRSEAPEVRSWREILDISGAARGAGLAQEPNELLQRATSVIAIVAERLLAGGSRTAATQSPLRFAASPDEMIALLLDPNGGHQRLAELRALVTELLRPRLTSVP